MIFILPIDSRDLARTAEDTVAKYQPGRQYEIEFVTRPRKRELSINVISRGPHIPSRRFRYQLLSLTKV